MASKLLRSLFGAHLPLEVQIPHQCIMLDFKTKTVENATYFPGMVVLFYYPNTQEFEARGVQVQRQPELHLKTDKTRKSSCSYPEQYEHMVLGINLIVYIYRSIYLIKMSHSNSNFLAYCNFYTFSAKFMIAMDFLNKI